MLECRGMVLFITRLHRKSNSMTISSGMMHNLFESDLIYKQAESGVMHDLDESGLIHDPSESGMMHNPAEGGVSVSQGVNETPVIQRSHQQQQRRHDIVHYSEIAFEPVEVPFSDVFAQSTTTASKSSKFKKGKRAKETNTVSSSKALKPTRETKTVSSNKVSRPVRKTKAVSSTKVLKPTRKISKRGTSIPNKRQWY